MSISTISPELKAYYTGYYRTEKQADSSSASRTHMTRIMTDAILKNEGFMAILDIGSGRRELEGSLYRNAKGYTTGDLRNRLSQTSLISFDIADIPARRMVSNKGQHVRADSTAMPFRDDSFDLTVSNLSIDMLRRGHAEFEQALQETSRVTKPGGLVAFNYHSPDLFDSLSQSYKENTGILGNFYDGNDGSNPYYQREADIVSDLVAADIAPISIDKKVVKSRRSAIADRWWQVIGKKVG